MPSPGASRNEETEARSPTNGYMASVYRRHPQGITCGTNSSASRRSHRWYARDQRVGTTRHHRDWRRTRQKPPCRDSAGRRTASPGVARLARRRWSADNRSMYGSGSGHWCASHHGARAFEHEIEPALPAGTREREIEERPPVRAGRAGAGEAASQLTIEYIPLGQ